MQKSIKKQSYVKSVKHLFKHKTNDSIWDEGNRLTKPGGNVSLTNYKPLGDKVTLLSEKQLYDSNNAETTSLEHLSRLKGETEGKTNRMHVPTELDLACVQRQQLPQYENGTRLKTNFKPCLTATAKQNTYTVKDETKAFSEKSIGQRHMSLMLSEETGCPISFDSSFFLNDKVSNDNNLEAVPNQDDPEEHERVPQEQKDPDGTSDYGTLETEADETDLKVTRAYYRSEPNLPSLAKIDEETNDLCPRNNYFFKVNKPKYVQITPGNGTASVSKTTVNTNLEDCEQTRTKRKYSDRHVSLLRQIRRTNPRVETELYKGAKDCLYRQGYYSLVILKGSGYGCRFAAKMLFERAVSEVKNGSKAYYLKSAEEMNQINPDEKAIVLAQDANGPTGSDIKRLDDWYEVLRDRMPTGNCVQNNLIIIMTLQDFSISLKRDHYILQRYSEYVVDASQKIYRPSNETKEKLFEAFLVQKKLRVAAVKGRVPASRPKDGKLFFLDKEIADGVVPLLGSVRFIGKLADYIKSDIFEDLNSLRTPIPEMVQRIRKSYEEGGIAFLTLLAVHAHCGQLGVGRINQMRKLNKHTEKFWQSADNIEKMSKKKSKKIRFQFQSAPLQHLYKFAMANGHLINLGNNLQRYARHLDGDFLSEKNNVYRFCDGRTYYSFLLVYCEKYISAIVDCEDNFFFNFVKSSRNSFGDEKDTFMPIDDRSLNGRTRAVMERFKNEMLSRRIAKCMKHPLMSTMFFKLFMKYLKETRHMLWTILRQQDSDPKEPYCCLYHGLDEVADTYAGVPRNITEVIFLHDKWNTKRKDPVQQPWMKAQESETLVHATELSNFQTFELMVEKKAIITTAALRRSMELGAEDFIDFIVENGKFSSEEWFEEALHAATIVSDEQSNVPKLSLTSVILKSNINQGIGEKPPFIHYAVQANNAAMLKMLVRGAFGNVTVDINNVYNGETPLDAAIRLGLPDIVTIMFDMKGEGSRDGVFIAASLGHEEVLEIMLERQPDCINIEDREGMTPLFHAAMHGHTEVVRKILLKHCSNKECVPVWQFPNNNSNKNSSYTFQEKRNRHGKTTLHIAAERGHSGVISLLLSHGFELMARDSLNETPLSLACTGRNIQAIRKILSALDTRKNEEIERVVIRTVQSDDRELLELLYEYNCSVNFFNQEYGAPLLVAIQYGMHDMIRFLLSKDANAEMQQIGYRPVHVAASKGDINSLNILKEFGADICARTDFKYNIIQIATERECIGFVETILQTPDTLCLMDHKSVDGETALHIACKMGSPSITLLLLQYGYNAKIPNRDGQLPLHLAEIGQKNAKFRRDKKKWNAYADCVKVLQNN